MPDLDDELLERVARWCAEAGRTTAADEIRRALGGLGWDELLAVRALLADPPPSRPLGPAALVDVARGAPPEVAAERERSGAYPVGSAAEDEAPPPAAGAPAAAPTARRSSAARAPRVTGPVIRRARDAAPPIPAPPPRLPLVDELLLPEGRTVLDRLVRRHGARRQAIVAALAEGWRRADGGPVDGALLERLLDHHGLARAFSRRERDELLHALRAAGGLRSAAAARLGIAREDLDAALVRTGAGADAERIREARRAEVRARATLAERVRLLLADPSRLEDLGLLAEIEEDLRRRLPEHLRALGAAGGPLLAAVARSLSSSPAEVSALADRLGVALDAGPAAPATSPRPAASRPPPRPRSRPGAERSRPAGAGGSRPPRPPGARGPRRGPGDARGPSRGPGAGPGPGRAPGGAGGARRGAGGARPPDRRRDAPWGEKRRPGERSGPSRGPGAGRGPGRGPRDAGGPSYGPGGARPTRAGGPRGKPQPHAPRTGGPRGKPQPHAPRTGGPRGKPQPRAPRTGGPRGKPPPRGPRRAGR